MPSQMNQEELLKVFNSLKSKQSVSVWYDSGIRSADSWTELQVGRKSKSKKYNLEKISLVYPDNPKGFKFYLYNRKGRISLAMGDMATRLIAIKTNGKKAESFNAELVALNKYPRGVIAGMIGGGLAIASYLVTKDDSIWQPDVPDWLKLGGKVLLITTGFAAGVYGSEVGYTIWDNKKL